MSEFKGTFPQSFFDEGVPYIEGAIQLTINGKKIIDKSMWDYVDQLWSYILEGVYKLDSCKTYTTYFPDQPIEIAFVNLNEMFIEIKFGENRVVAEKSVVIPSLVESGLEFFRSLQKILPDEQSVKDEIDKANKFISDGMFK